MNVVILTGRLTKDVELKFGQSGKAYTRFGLAVENPYKKDDVDFVNCVAFGKTAELLAEYVRKGRKIGVTGNLHMNRYEKDGEKRVAHDVVVNSLEFLTPKGTTNTDNTPQGQAVNNNGVENDDDFPF